MQRYRRTVPLRSAQPIPGFFWLAPQIKIGYQIKPNHSKSESEKENMEPNQIISGKKYKSNTQVSSYCPTLLSSPGFFCLAPPNQNQISNQNVPNPIGKKIISNQIKWNWKKIQVSGGAWRAVPRRLRSSLDADNGLLLQLNSNSISRGLHEDSWTARFGSNATVKIIRAGIITV